MQSSTLSPTRGNLHLSSPRVLISVKQLQIQFEAPHTQASGSLSSGGTCFTLLVIATMCGGTVSQICIFVVFPIQKQEVSKFLLGKCFS